MIEQFRDFAASKPADEAYPEMIKTKCAIAQFMKSLGIDPAPPWPPEFRRLDRHVLGRGHVSTFGALTERLDATLTRATGDA